MTVSAEDRTVCKRHPTFQAKGHLLLERLQNEMRNVVTQLKGVRTPSELQEALGINYNLSWRVMRTVDARCPLEAGPFVPAHISVKKKLLTAARRHGVTNHIAELEAASEAFHEFVVEYAGDRATFDTAIASLTGSDAARVDTELKRNAFRVNSQLYGKRLDTVLMCVIMRPSDEQREGDFLVDSAHLRCYMGLRRFRQDSSLEVDGLRWDLIENGKAREILKNRALDSAALERFGAPIVPEFCSDPPPALRQETRSDGGSSVLLTTPDLGLRADVSCVLGEVYRNIPAEPDERVGYPVYDCRFTARIPAEVAVLDVLIHERLFTDKSPQLTMLSSSNRAYGFWPEEGAADLFPIQEQVAEVARTPNAMHVPRMPRYCELVDHTFEKLGWGDLSQFRVFRSEVEYPVMNTLHWMRFALTDPRGK